MYIRGSIIRNVKVPHRAHPHDSGMDFFVPEFTDSFVEDFNSKEQNIKHGVQIKSGDQAIILKPGQGMLMPSGVKVEIPIGWEGVFQDKSGVASKNGLIIGSKVIDTYYSGEVHINMWNVSNFDVTITPGNKIVQLTLHPVGNAGLLIIPENQLYSEMYEEDHRGESGFGSTNK